MDYTLMDHFLKRSQRHFLVVRSQRTTTPNAVTTGLGSQAHRSSSSLGRARAGPLSLLGEEGGWSLLGKPG